MLVDFLDIILPSFSRWYTCIDLRGSSGSNRSKRTSLVDSLADSTNRECYSGRCTDSLLDTARERKMVGARNAWRDYPTHEQIDKRHLGRETDRDGHVMR